MAAADHGLWSSLLGHWDMLAARPGGPLSFRILVQPLVAAAFGIREGVRDARASEPPYGWLLITHSQRRGELLRQGWSHVRKVFLAALIIDTVYELMVFHRIYPGQTVVVAIALAVLPYVLVRGLTNRLARPWIK
jgi:hypothetical protein